MTSHPRLRAAAVLAAATCACWFAWMGWDRHYDVDPVTGVWSGPFQPWQVIGCVLCLVAAAVVGVRWLPVPVVVVVMTVVFTASWSASAATQPDSGPLWPVGAVLVLLGMVGGTSVVAGLARAVVPEPPPSRR